MNKNLLGIKGTPLIDYTIHSSINSSYLSEIYITSDSRLITSRVKNTRIMAPDLRPTSLANDNSLTIDVVKHVILNWLKKYELDDYIVLLQPTSPLRTSKHIDEACSILLKHSEDNLSLTSVSLVNSSHPNRMKRINYEGYLENLDGSLYDDMSPRQSLPKVYIRNGALYINKIYDILQNHRLTNSRCIPYIMNENESYNIDSVIDKFLVEKQLEGDTNRH